jgi:4a-hydroxytetrahydrobiopterin dehydratase
MNLVEKSCTPCSAKNPTLEISRAKELLGYLGSKWEFNADGHLEKTFVFKDFVESMDFANSITLIAEKEKHHPDLYISWGKCVVEIWTHNINGLSENDFYLAAKIENIAKKSS